MIPFASQRGSGGDLASHLSNSHDNETVELSELRGSIADDLHGAFAEWEAQAGALTKAKNYLYSLSINPDPRQGRLSREQYDDYIARVETSLGLADQPRATVFHIKAMPDGHLREHCHVIWSRVDCENGRAVPIAFDREKLMRVTIGFAKDHGLNLPAGYESRFPDKPQLSLHEKAQQDRTGLTREERMELITQIWTQSDSAKAFVAALEDNGYLLASGKRPYVLVDIHGQTNSLPKLIHDRSIRTKDVCRFLERDYPSENLPSVDDAKAIVATLTDERQAAQEQQQQIERLEALEADQAERRDRLETKLAAERERANQTVNAISHRHSLEKSALTKTHAQKNLEVEFTRAANKPNGLAAFLGRISGVEFVRKKLHERERIKREEAQRLETERQNLRHQNDQETQIRIKALLLFEHSRHKLSLDKVFQRERNSLTKSETRENTQRLNATHLHQAPLPERLRQTKSEGSNMRKAKTIRVQGKNLARRNDQTEDKKEVNLTDEFDFAAEDHNRHKTGDSSADEFIVSKNQDKGRKR